MARLIILRLLETYFRHRWLYLLPIVLMTALAVAFLYTAKPKYQAQGVLYVQNESLLSTLTAVAPTDGSWWVTPAQATMGQMNELLQTDSFIRAMIQQTGLEADMQISQTEVNTMIEETRKAVWVFSQGDNQVLVASSHEQPQVSQQLVLAVIEGYIQWQINAQRAESESAQSFFTDLITRYEVDLEAARNEMRGYLQAHPEPIRDDRPSLEQLELAHLQSEIDLAANRYSSALDKQENAELSLAQIESDTRQTFLLIDAPRQPEEPTTSLKDIAINSAIFIAAGVVMSAAAIAGAAVLDRTFRFPVDVEQRLGLPVLTMVPDTTPPHSLFSRFSRRSQQPEPRPVKPRKPLWKPVHITLQIQRNSGGDAQVEPREREGATL